MQLKQILAIATLCISTAVAAPVDQLTPEEIKARGLPYLEPLFSLPPLGAEVLQSDAEIATREVEARQGIPGNAGAAWSLTGCNGSGHLIPYWNACFGPMPEAKNSIARYFGS